MDLSVNYSVEVDQLLRGRRIRFDRIKCPDWPDMIATARAIMPVYVHFPLDAGTRTGRPPNFATADAMARDTDTPFVNLHLVTWHRDYPDYPPDSTDAGLKENVIRQMIDDVEAAAKVIDRGRLILEN